MDSKEVKTSDGIFDKCVERAYEYFDEIRSFQEYEMSALTCNYVLEYIYILLNRMNLYKFKKYADEYILACISVACKYNETELIPIGAIFRMYDRDIGKITNYELEVMSVLDCVFNMLTVSTIISSILEEPSDIEVRDIFGSGAWEVFQRDRREVALEMLSKYKKLNL